MNAPQALLIALVAGAVGPAALYFFTRHLFFKIVAQMRETGACPMCAQIHAQLANLGHAHAAYFPADLPFPADPPPIFRCPWTVEGKSEMCGKPGTHLVPEGWEWDDCDGRALCLRHFEELARDHFNELDAASEETTRP